MALIPMSELLMISRGHLGAKADRGTPGGLPAVAEGRRAEGLPAPMPGALAGALRGGDRGTGGSHGQGAVGEKACQFCGYEFDQEKLGRYGCPNCCGEGVE